MLRNTGIRSKVLAVLALPVLVLVLAAGVISAGALSDAARASRTEALVGALPDLSALVRDVQTERYVTATLLAGDGSRAGRLDEVRTAVDDGVAALDAALDATGPAEAGSATVAALAAAQDAHATLPALRAAVDAGSLSPARAADAYDDVVAADVTVPERVAAAQQDVEVAAALRAYSGVERTIDLVLAERDVVALAVVAGTVDADTATRARGLAMQQDLVREQARIAAGPTGVSVPTEPAYTFGLARADAVGADGGPVTGIDVDGWRAAAQAEVSSLASVEQALAAAAAQRTARLAADARATAWQVVVLAALLVLLPVLIALSVSRLITRPLRSLTEAATTVRDALPALVEQAHGPGHGPDVELPDIPVDSDDEVGRLARAFNAVNTTTLEVAREQAALRGSIAAMFVNVARRDQVLLSRQLAFIDQLERTEENPQTLENLFRLDHLATRMRRNAESLLVLAGIDTGRRLRRPLPLSDVVRTASSEIEHYERVDLAMQVDPPLVGHNALAAAHLLAELLENATTFSDPGSRVVVSTASGRRGVVVTITDDGLGMSREELDDANARIADPPVSEVVGAQRLGFYVVGRLARRLEVAVELQAGVVRGTVVRLELPPALFVPGTVVELPSGDVAAEPAPTGPSTPAATARETTAAPAPTAPAPAAPAPAAAAPSAAPPLPMPGSDQAVPGPEVRDDGAALPTRRRPQTPNGPGPEAPATPATARSAAPPAAPEDGQRGGLFSSFRARSADAPDAAPPVAPTPPAPAASTPPATPPAASARPPAPAPAAQPAPGRDTRQAPAVTPVPAVAPVAVRAAEALAPRPAPAATRDILPGGGAGRPSRRFARRRPTPGAVETAATRSTVGAEGARPAAPGAPAPGWQAGAGAALSAYQPSAQQPAAYQPTVAAAPGPIPTRAGGGSPQAAEPQTRADARSGAAVQPVGDVLRQRSALASEALSELSLLSTYAPPSVAAGAPASLARRTPAATPAARLAAPRPAAHRRTRDAADVRSMLSGFQAGVQRGRTEGPATETDDEQGDGS